MSLVTQFNALLNSKGSNAIYHRESAGQDCPCLSPEGYRTPRWHLDNPLEPVCNEEGKINVVTTSVTVKAFVQPIATARSVRMATEYIYALFGEVRADDHFGIFPLVWSNVSLDFDDWSQSGRDYIEYDNHRYIVVSSNRIPDPSDGGPHHYEVGLRRIDA